MTCPADHALIAILDEHRDRMIKVSEHFKLYPISRPPETKPSYDEMQAEVEAALNQHPIFGKARSLFIFSRQICLWPMAQASNLLKRASSTNGKEAMEWLYRVWNTQVADVDIIAEIHGLLIRETVTFSNGVRLLPPNELEDTPQARALVAQSMALLSVMNVRFPAAGVVTIKDVPAVNGMDFDEGHQRYLEQVNLIRRTVIASSLSEQHSPTLGVSWIDFRDANLNAASFGSAWQGATYDGRQAEHPIELTSEAIEWVEKFLALKGSIASKCDVALARLNLARRRQTPGDKAIDGCIALEALLTDGQPGDLTYKLRIRAARLLGATYAERQEISDAVGKFYRLRGKVVHGQSLGASSEDRDTADKGLRLVLRAVRAIVSNAKIPSLTELDLGPLTSQGTK